jgi:hypothetical protein
MENKINADRLAKVYVKIREARRELASKDKELEEKQNLVCSANS